MNYTNEELEDMLDDIEADNVERKESWSEDAKDKGRQAVCAFANDLPNHRKSGVLFIGVKDNGQPSNLPITDVLLQTIADMKTDGNILPFPSIVVQKRYLKGYYVAVVIVLPADSPPVRYKGRIWIRIGTRRGLATAQDERILSEKRRWHDIPFDLQPVLTATIDNISILQFSQEYLPNAFAADVLEANERTIEQRLATCRMIVSAENTTPTVLGILSLGKRPRDFVQGDYIQFLRIDGTEITDPIIDAEEIDGSVAQIIRRIDEKLDSHNRVAIDVVSGSVEIIKPDYPMIALRQLTRNAVMHRTYEGTNSPTRVYWFNDRIEIISPGGPFGEVTISNFGQPGITDYRNKNLADAMKVFGLVQRFGIGIGIAKRELEKNGNPPLEFEVQQTVIFCRVRKSLECCYRV